MDVHNKKVGKKKKRDLNEYAPKEVGIPTDLETEWEASSLFDVKTDSKSHATTENAGKKP